MSLLMVLAVCILLIMAQGIYRNWGQKTFDALPATIDEPSEWVGKDHDKVWYTRWVKYVKGWFAVGPLSKYRWAQWRRTPRTLFAIKGKGSWRFEQDGADDDVGLEDDRMFSMYLEPWKQFWGPDAEWYLSRVQYYNRWHFAVQWPLQLTFHVYWKERDVPRYPLRPGELGMLKLLNIYGPTHRDADRVYWIFSFFIGGVWK